MTPVLLSDCCGSYPAYTEDGATVCASCEVHFTDCSCPDCDVERMLDDYFDAQADR